MVKHLHTLTVVSSALLVMLWAGSAVAQDAAEQLTRVRTIVLDPGHGGEDTGTVGICGREEKELILEYAFALRDALLERDPSLRVVLTREVDEYVPLEERTRIANEARADLFVSLHANAAPNPRASGVETFFLAPVGTALGDVVPGRLEDGPTRARQEVGVSGETLAVLMDDLRRDGAARESSRLAEHIQDALVRATGARDRGVREGRFRVLRGIRMPAVVVEIGFLSHEEEGRRLQDPAYQQRVIDGLVAGLTGFDAWAAVVMAEWTPPPLGRTAADAAAGTAEHAPAPVR